MSFPIHVKSWNTDPSNDAALANLSKMSRIKGKEYDSLSTIFSDCYGLGHLNMNLFYSTYMFMLFNNLLDMDNYIVLQPVHVLDALNKESCYKMILSLITDSEKKKIKTDTDKILVILRLKINIVRYMYFIFDYLSKRKDLYTEGDQEGGEEDVSVEENSGEKPSGSSYSSSTEEY